MAKVLRNQADRPGGLGENRTEIGNITTTTNPDAAKPLRVALVGEDESLLLALRKVVEAEANWTLDGYVNLNAKEVLAVVQATRPDLLLIGNCVPGRTDLQIIGHLRALLPALPIVILGAHSDARGVLDTLSIGGYRPAFRPLEPREFPLAPCHPPLTVRECQILSLMDEGLIYKEIRARLGLSAGLMNKLLHGLFKRLGAHNRAEAVNHWHRLAGSCSISWTEDRLAGGIYLHT